jgi:anti-anti-sigma regulatory factor
MDRTAPHVIDLGDVPTLDRQRLLELEARIRNSLREGTKVLLRDAAPAVRLVLAMSGLAEWVGFLTSEEARAAA